MHLHAEGLCPSHHLPPDLPHADNAQPAVATPAAENLVKSQSAPPALAHQPIVFHSAAAAHQDMHEGDVSGAFGADTGHVGYCDAPPFSDVRNSVVPADAGGSDDPLSPYSWALLLLQTRVRLDPTTL